MPSSVRPNMYVPFGSVSVGTAPSVAWTPATGKKARVSGGMIAQFAGGANIVDLLAGTAAAAGTLLSIPVSATAGESSAFSLDYGRSVGTVDVPMGIKVRSGAGTIGGTFYGRED